MTEKQVISAFAAKFDLTEATAKEYISGYVDMVVSEAMDNGKCTFGKIGTFKRADVAAKAGRHVPAEKSMHGKAYDIPAQPARTKLAFAVSKSGKLLGK